MTRTNRSAVHRSALLLPTLLVLTGITARVAVAQEADADLRRAAADAIYDVARESPFELLAAPPDGLAYHRDRMRLSELVAAGRRGEASELAAQIASAYPRDGENWLWVGRVAWQMRDYARAAFAYEVAGELLGFGPPYVAGANVAINRLLLGDTAGALAELRRDVFERRSIFRETLFGWDSFSGLRENAEFRSIVGRADTAGLTRTERWRRDIDHLFEETKRVNPVYRNAPFPDELMRRYEELKRRVPALSDEEIFMGLNRMLAVLRQGHVSLFAGSGNRYLPLRLYAFPDGLYIVEASAPHAHLAGSRVIAAGDLPIEEALRRLSEARSFDGDMENLWAAWELATTHHLKGIGAIERTDTVVLTLRGPDGATSRAAIATTAVEPASRQDRLLPPPAADVPLFLSRMDEKHWEHPMPELGALYVQINNLVDEPGESLPAFGLRLREELQRQDVSSLVLDLRHNNGGVTQQYPELLRTIVAFSVQPGHQVYVLIGRRTYSAAANFITDLERLADPIFVGEASSACCDFHGDPTLVRLPYSGILAEVTAVKWNLTWHVFDERREMSPDVPVQLTAADYFAGRDPALAALRELIGERAGRATGSGS